MNQRHISNYYIWAGKKTRVIIDSLTDEEYYHEIDQILGSVRGKVTHMVLAILICFHHLKLDFKYLRKTPEETINHLNTLNKKDFMQCWQLSDELFAKQFKDEHTGTVTLSRKDGESYCLPIGDLLLQYLFHTIYHRGQLNYCLKALKKPRVDTDYLFYFMDLDQQMEQDM